MILSTLGKKCDLTTYWYNMALASLPEDEGGVSCLYVNTAQMDQAEKLNVLYRIDTNLPDYAWYVTGKSWGIYSSGA